MSILYGPYSVGFISNISVYTLATPALMGIISIMFQSVMESGKFANMDRLSRKGDTV